MDVEPNLQVRPLIASLGLFLLTLLPSCGWPEPEARFYHASTHAEKIARVAHWTELGFGWSNVGYTGSMRPFLKGGEILITEPYLGQPLRKGMVLVFRRDGVQIVHMVADFNQDAVYFSGVNNHWSDGWIPLSQVLYVVNEIVTGPDK